MERKLRKVVAKKWIGGVVAGIAYWLGIPAWIARLVWVFLLLAYGAGFLLYILLWIFMPRWQETPGDYDERSGG